MKWMSLISALMLLGTLGARLKPVITSVHDSLAEVPAEPDEVDAVSNKEQDDDRARRNTWHHDDATPRPEVTEDDVRTRRSTSLWDATPKPEEREEAARRARRSMEALQTLHDSLLKQSKTIAKRTSKNPLTPGRARRSSKQRLIELYEVMEPRDTEFREQDDKEFERFLSAEAELWRLVEEKAVLTAEAELSQDDSEKASLAEAVVAKAFEVGQHARGIRIALHHFNKHKTLLDDVQIEDMIKAAAGDDWEAEAITRDEAGKDKMEAESGAAAKDTAETAEVDDVDLAIAKAADLSIEDMVDPEAEMEEQIEDDIEDMIEADLRATSKNMLDSAAGGDWEVDSDEEDDAATEDDEVGDSGYSREVSLGFDHSGMIADEIGDMLDFEHDIALVKSSTAQDLMEEIEADMREAKAAGAQPYKNKEANLADEFAQWDKAAAAAEEDEAAAAAEMAEAKAAQARG